MLYNDYILITLAKQRQRELERLAEQAHLIKAVKDARPTQGPHVLTNLKGSLAGTIGNLPQRVAQVFRQVPEVASASPPEQCIGSAATPQPAAAGCNCS
jgi:hypothetical protein